MRRPPEMIGLMTYTRGYQNGNILWKDGEDTFFSLSLVATAYRATAQSDVSDPPVPAPEDLVEAWEQSA
jgi:hypothetical protein